MIRSGVLMFVADVVSAEGVVAAATARATRWLFESGIQHESGGCHSWFDAERGYQALYPEVSGYHLTFAEWAGRSTADRAARSAAQRSASWLVGLVDAEGGFPCLVRVEDSGTREQSRTDASFLAKTSRRYTFDAGIVLQGLSAHAARTGSPEVRAAALELGAWLVRQQRADGTFTPFTGPQDWRAVAADWSTRPGCHQAKIAIGLLALAELTGDPDFSDAASRAVSAGLAFQQPDGRFVTNEVTGGSNVHPHSYAAEACWAVGTATGDRELVASARRATRFVLDRSPAGAVFRTFRPGADGSTTVSPMRIDGLAQTLRLAVLAEAATDQECAALAETLITHQAAAEDRRVDGGFSFGFSSDGQRLPHANVWVSAFAAQALELYSSGPALDWRYFV